MDDHVRGSIQESLQRRHGSILRLQGHDAPEWLGKGWLVSFELPSIPREGMPVIRAALFHDENGRPVLAREFDVRDAEGNYPKWKPLAGDGRAD
jgi:hypothetical protein